ncbi:hypothetical protein GBA52_024253 [Prunus armeniaca]|nr:hypothetical protein GBA52_024253 [Prunus armeniaca]
MIQMKSNEEAQAQAAKKTRELPNLSECHSCHLRVDIANANAKSKLHVLYSEWRIVLLCKKCFSRVESSELCSYCYSTSSSQESFSCRQCHRKVHRHCDSEYRSVALLSDSCSAMEFSVCADCWIPESLVKWKRVVSSSKSRRTGKRRVGLGLGKSRVLAMVDDREIDDAFGSEEGSNRRDEDAAVDVDDGQLEPRALDIEEESGDDDDDEPLKEGDWSCSNGDDLESPAFCKQEQEESVCITTPKKQRCNAKLDPFYFKYRKRSTPDRYVLTYKRRSPKNLNASSMVTYKRRKPKCLYACYTFTYKRRRPRILYARSTGSS